MRKGAFGRSYPRPDNSSFSVRSRRCGNYIGSALLRVENETNESCSEVVATLSNTYGPPGNKSVVEYGEGQKWFDQVNRNAVFYGRIGDVYCEVLYMPLKSPGEEGGL